MKERELTYDEILLEQTVEDAELDTPLRVFLSHLISGGGRSPRVDQELADGIEQVLAENRAILRRRNIRPSMSSAVEYHGTPTAEFVLGKIYGVIGKCPECNERAATGPLADGIHCVDHQSNGAA